MNRIQIGWASRDISTDKPISIPGQFHIRVSQGVMDPVTSTALVVSDGNDCVIFVCADVVVMRCGLVDEVREKTAKLCPEIPVRKILMNATHTHTGPGFYRDATNLQATSSLSDEIPRGGVEIYPSDLYRDWLSTTIAEMVVEAWNKKSEGGVAYGYGYAVVGHSRRACYFDDTSLRAGAVHNSTHSVNGHAIMYGNTNDDNFSHYETNADHFVNLMYTFDKDNNLTGAIVNVPCPSQNSENESRLSADYWHDVREAIRAKHGNIFILTQCAAGGDSSPRILHYKAAQARRFRLKYGAEVSAGQNRSTETELAARKDIAERVSQAFDEVLSWAKKDIRTEAKVAHQVTDMRIQKRIISDEECEMARKGLAEAMAREFVSTDNPMADLKHNSVIVAGRNRYRNVIYRWEQQKTDKTMPMELHVLNIGDIAFASNRFELYTDFQHRMQARSPFEQTFIIQLAGQPGEEGGNYLCTERAALNRGYSASVFCNIASAAAGQEIVEETVKQLKKLYQNI